MIKNISAFILAGGQSSRMGQDKGLMPFNGKLMIEHSIDTLKTIVIDIFIVSNNPIYNQFNLPLLSDITPNKGPAGGIYTALSHSKTEHNLILSCDTPFVNQQLIQYLLDRHESFDITIPKINEKKHPLIGIYNKTCKSFYKKSIEDNTLKLDLINQQLKYNVVTIDPLIFSPKLFHNINTPQDLKQTY